MGFSVWGSLFRGVCVQGVFVQGGLCLGGGLCPGESLSRRSLSRGVSVSVEVSVQGSLYPGGLCQGGSLSRWGSLSGGRTSLPLWTEWQTEEEKKLPCAKLYLWAVKYIKTQKLLGGCARSAVRLSCRNMNGGVHTEIHWSLLGSYICFTTTGPVTVDTGLLLRLCPTC